MNRRINGWMDGCLSWRPLSRRTTTSEKPKESHDYQVSRCKLGDAANSPVLSPDRIRKELHFTFEPPRLYIMCIHTATVTAYVCLPTSLSISNYLVVPGQRPTLLRSIPPPPYKRLNHLVGSLRASPANSEFYVS
jgi:hypothetical protein